ncbi:unnamed protein product [Rhizophagus irregularis]|nr:unnamed protein product [Rhizophagus irregularis]
MKSMIIFFLIHKFLDTAAAADSSNGNDSSGLKTSTKIIIAVVAVIGVFVIGTLIYCFRKAKPKKRKIRDIENIREPLMTTSTPDVRLTVTTNPSLIQPSGTTTPSRVPPQTPLTPPQPQHSAIPSATQTTLAKVTESLEDSISYPTRKSTTEIIVTTEVTESHRPRPHTIEQRDSPPQSRQLEQATRSRDTSPYRQYHEYEQTFDTPIDPRLQTQTRRRPDSVYSFDDNPGPTVPSPRPLQRSSPGSSQRSRRGRDRRGGNR